MARNCPRFTRQGRTILRNGIPILEVARTGNSTDGWELRPHDTDKFVRHIVQYLNVHCVSVGRVAAARARRGR